MRKDPVPFSPLDPSKPLLSPRNISAPATLAAHQHLLEACGRMSLRAEPHSSALAAIKLYDRDNRYLFSWIINARHLLFYIRKPALKLVPALKARAQTASTGVKANPAGEVTVRIETALDAAALTEWLFDPQTWATAALDPPTVHLPDVKASARQPRALHD